MALTFVYKTGIFEALEAAGYSIAQVNGVWVTEQSEPVVQAFMDGYVSGTIEESAPDEIAAVSQMTAVGFVKRTGPHKWSASSGISLTADVTGVLPVANGGTGGDSQSAALTSLGGTTLGKNLFQLENPGAVTYLRVNADNTVSALAASAFLAAIGGGGGGATPPGGSSTQIQFNNSGAFAGSANLTYDPAENRLKLTGTDPELNLGGVTTEPGVPSAGTLFIYAKEISGKMVLKLKGPSGLDFPLQTAFWQNNIVMWNPTTATAGSWLGSAGAGAGTFSTALPTAGSTNYQAMKRARWANVVTTTNQILGQRNTEAMYFRGSIAGQGGFFMYARGGVDVWTNGGRFFAGFHTSTAVVTAEPSALNNTVGFCVDSGDNGAISFLTRGTAATKATTGFTLANNTGFDFYIFSPPNGSFIAWMIVNLNTGAEASGVATATLPSATVMKTAGVLASNAALTTVTAIQIGLNRIYLETDY